MIVKFDTRNAAGYRTALDKLRHCKKTLGESRTKPSRHHCWRIL
jgi:hypothetical protein